MPYKKKKQALDEDGNPLPLAPPRSSWPVEVTLYLLVLLSPLALGTVHLGPVLGMLALALFAAAALLLRTRRRQLPIKLFPMGAVLLAGVGLTGLQLIPLPPGLVGFLSPGAAEVFDSALSGTPLADSWRPLSMSAPSTVLALYKMLAATLVFITVVNYFTDRHRARRLLKAIAWSGFLVALVGFFTKLFMAKEILGFHPLPHEVFFFSTFVNPNHMAGFLLMCSPLALGLALSAKGRQDRALFGFMGVIMGVAVFMSLSRGGMVAYTAGIAFLSVYAATRRARRLKHTVLVQVAAAGVLLISGYLAYDAVLKEFSTLGDVDAIREETKIQSWQALGPMIGDHPVVGIGRGAHATVYPRYKTLSTRSTFTHAENQTLQYLVDWGPVFGGLFILTLMGCFVMGLRRARHSYAMGGLLAGLFAAMLHNQVDFNLETGAVMGVFFAMFGLVAAAPFMHAGAPAEIETRLQLPRTAAWGLIALGLVLAIGLSPGAYQNEFFRQTNALVAAQNQKSPAEPCDESALGKAACELMAHHPADYLAPLLIGRNQLEADNADLNKALRWLSTAMFLNPTDPTAHSLAGRALYQTDSKDQALMEYRMAAQHAPGIQTATITEVLRLSNDPEAAIAATPHEPEALLKTARILNTLGRKEAAAKAARIALEHDSSSLKALDLLARLAFDAGRLDEAADLARQAIDVDALHEGAWVLRGQVLLKQDKQAEAENLWREGWAQVPDSTLIGQQLVELYIRTKRYKEAESATTRMQTFAAPDDRSHARLLMLGARIKEARQLYFDARQLYRQAVELQPGNLPYLYRLGLMEEKVGAWDEAQRIYKQLAEARFRSREMKERIDLVGQAREIEKNRAKWNELVEPKDAPE